ncbi:MAG: vitamin K epoxide reductase family protein [Candidatus Rokubacteria bacterium]|nr:vitamin K epoxide reductase family protein [Candidatus Rokubacteria bacterium]
MPPKRTPPARVVTRDWPVTAIAAAGLLVSAYLTATKLTGATAAFCEAGSGCDVVQASRYATFLGVPTAAWGIGLYAIVVALALAGFTVKRWQIAFVLGVVAVSFSAYLAYLQLVVLQAICAWCVLDALIAVALLGALIWRRPLPTGRRSPNRPARIGVIGGVTAVLTIAFAIGAYVGDGPASSGSHRESLARHLASTGAVFYGAYW